MNKPEIVISNADHDRLTRLANGLLDNKPELAEELLAELERAKVVEPAAVPGETVQMGAAVTYETGEGQRREVTLVYPADADISLGRVSILTPIGTALLGLAVGQSIDWVANDGRSHQLKVVSVREAASAQG